MKIYRQKEAEFNFETVMDFLLKYRMPIIIITLLAAISAMIFSSPYFMPPKYKSTAVFFATTTNSISKALLQDAPGQKTDILAPGEEEEAEQMLQYLQSDMIAKRIIEKFHLMKHYGIDPKGSYPYTRLLKAYNENITSRRTEFMSLEINVLDENADTAALIANNVLALVDSAKNEIIQKRAKEALKIVEEKYNEKQTFINSLVDSLKKIGDLGVPSYSSQGIGLDQEYARALGSNNVRAANEIKKKTDLYNRFSAIQKSFLDRIEFENKQLAMLHDKYEQAKVDAEKFLPATFVVNKATAAEKKHWPVRSVIVLVSSLSALALSILFFAFLSNIQEYRRSKKVGETTQA